jgi:hypothetical protein
MDFSAAERARLIMFDVDGVLTDGKISSCRRTEFLISASRNTWMSAMPPPPHSESLRLAYPISLISFRLGV